MKGGLLLSLSDLATIRSNVPEAKSSVQPVRHPTSLMPGYMVNILDLSHVDLGSLYLKMSLVRLVSLVAWMMLQGMDSGRLRLELAGGRLQNGLEFTSTTSRS